jgi:Fe-S-cluster-containing hydrogenase component 2
LKEGTNLRKLSVDAEKCSGCRYCELVCSYHHNKVFNPSLSRITVFKKDSQGFDYPLFCRQCKSCTAAEACPSEALIIEEGGVVRVEKNICTGCGTCVEACEYMAIRLDNAGNPLICDLCQGDPECSSRCPTEALKFSEIKHFDEKYETALAFQKKRWELDV